MVDDFEQDPQVPKQGKKRSKFSKFQSKGRRRKYLAGSSLISKTSFEGSVHKAALCG